MPQNATLSKLAELAEDQWGLLTRRQAEEAGVSPATLQRLSDGATLERVGHGVYRLAGAPLPDHAELRGAWLQLAPETPAWRRTAEQGVISHRSAAALFGIGHLPADVHEFILPRRRQVRRPDVRIHKALLRDDEWINFRGLLVTKPARIASDLLSDGADPESVAQTIADALREWHERPYLIARSLEPNAARLGLRRGDGISALRWLLDLIDDPETSLWVAHAREPVV